ncbi:hypothetical protein, partial [Archangium sp.]|uniref:hypothetical protein n=1 Tax=Archangium sp. TaxID=1872627 RepID=UPI002D335F54
EKKLPVEIGRRFFRWQGKTYGRSDDGLAVALPNPWNAKRTLYLYLAKSGPQLWHMTRTFQPGQLQGWAQKRPRSTAPGATVFRRAAGVRSSA